MIKFSNTENVFAKLGQRPTEHPEDLSHTKTTQLFFKLFTGIFITFFLWALVGTLDIVSMIKGEVIPSSKVKSVQHLEGGIVRKIDVREGQVVKKGQALVHLEQIISGADLSELQVRTNSLIIRIARLEAESKGQKAPTFTPKMEKNFPIIVTEEMDQFRTWTNNLMNQLEAQQEVIAQKSETIRQIISRLANMKSSLELHQEKVTISEELLKDELTNRYIHLDLLTKLNELKGSISETQSNLSSANSALKEAQAQHDQIQTSAMNDVQRDLNDSRETCVN
ncbi:MAG: biotin/lipoyl-binding protein [Magnetovibrio sp.]|nr:biotin/lipoyl-binding protein [Magnetovibrio sp.]